MKLMKLAMAGVAVLTLIATTASAGGPKLWQPDIFRLGSFGRQDAQLPTPADAPAAGEMMNLPEGSYIIEGDHSSYYGNTGCGCDDSYSSCNSCNRGCNLFGWLKLGRKNSCGCDSCGGHGFSLFKHNWFGSGCDSCQQQVSCCAPRKSFRLFSGNLFGRKNDCCAVATSCCDPAPVCDSCDPCGKRGWMDKFLSWNTRRDCNYAPSCCEAAPACDSGCGLSLFGWLKRGHGNNCGCDTCGGYVSSGEYYYGGDHGHEHMHAPTEMDAPSAVPVPSEAPANAMPAPMDSDAI